MFKKDTGPFRIWSIFPDFWCDTSNFGVIVPSHFRKDLATTGGRIRLRKPAELSQAQLYGLRVWITFCIAPAEGVSRFHPKTKTNSEDEFHTYLFRRRITTRRRFTSRKQRRRRLPRRRVTPRRRITSRRRIPKTHSTKTSYPAKTNHLPKTHSEDTFQDGATRLIILTRLIKNKVPQPDL